MQRPPQHPFHVHVIAALTTTLALAGCGGDTDNNQSEPPATTVASTDSTSTTQAADTTEPTTPAEPLATVIRIDASVDARIDTASDFTEISEPTGVNPGDEIRTDTAGFAEITYFDGSLTRLDTNTDFTVIELTNDADVSTIRTEMGTGRTWHRVQELTGDDTYEVTTSVATATVRGTAFVITCPDDTTCEFMVAEGTLRVDLDDDTSIELIAPAALVVDSEQGAGEIVPVPFDGAFGDDWLFDNAGRDVSDGFPTAGEIYQAHGAPFGSLSGTFTGTKTVTSAECEPQSTCQLAIPPVGEVGERSYTFEIDCSNGVPCTGTIDTEYRRGNEPIRETVPVEFDGTSYRWTLAYSVSACILDDGVETGNRDDTQEWTMTPTAAEIIDDRWVITEMSGDGSAVNIVTDDGGCAGMEGSFLLASIASSYAVARLS